MIFASWLFVLFGTLFVADEPTGLTLSDLAPYRAALDGKPDGPATTLTFRQLWDASEAFEGKRVRVEGRVARRFRQGAFGTFPPLIESWAVTPSGDPFCLVYPAPALEDSSAANDPAPGALIAFEGVYLKRLKYQGSDTERLALMIVGDRLPTSKIPAPTPASKTALGGIPEIDWALGLGAAGLVALALARRHLRAPSRSRPRSHREKDPPPEFIEQA